MRIGGLQASSLIDFPGTISAVVFTVGCNFRCPYCHNPDLVLETPERIIPTEEILEFLRARQGVLPAVTVTGGEPTMHEDLCDFLAQIRALGYRIKLDTNGTNPEMLERAVERGLVDYVAMDIKAPLARYARVVGSTVNTTAISRSVAFLLEGGVEYEFRTTVVRSQLSAEDIMEIGKELSGAKRYYLQQFVPAKTLHPTFRRAMSYSTQELREFAHALSASIDHCDVRG